MDPIRMAALSLPLPGYSEKFEFHTWESLKRGPKKVSRPHLLPADFLFQRLEDKTDFQSTIIIRTVPKVVRKTTFDANTAEVKNEPKAAENMMETIHNGEQHDKEDLLRDHFTKVYFRNERNRLQQLIICKFCSK